VAVGGVDVVAQPDPRVGDAQVGRSQPGVDRGAGAVAGRVVVLLEPKLPGAAEREPIEQRLGQAVVVVAGHDRHLALAQCLTQLLEEGTGGVEGNAEREVAQLDHVAEQDDAVGVADLLQQDASHRRVAQHVLTAGGAEVEVGDDRRPHPTVLSADRVWLCSQAG
jgi:hypothetical protein